MPERLIRFKDGREKVLLVADVPDPDNSEKEYISAQGLCQICFGLVVEIRLGTNLEKIEQLKSIIQESIIQMGGVQTIDRWIETNDPKHNTLSPNINRLKKSGVIFQDVGSD